MTSITPILKGITAILVLITLIAGALYIFGYCNIYCVGFCAALVWVSGLPLSLSMDNDTANEKRIREDHYKVTMDRIVDARLYDEYHKVKKEIFKDLLSDKSLFEQEGYDLLKEKAAMLAAQKICEDHKILV
jgi:hypothetical protein